MEGTDADVAKRRGEKAANATINRELAWLKHMFTLAVRAGRRNGIRCCSLHAVSTGAGL